VRGDGRSAQIWEALASQLAIDPPLGEDIHSDDWQQGMDDAFERAVIEILANVRRLGSRADADSVIRGISATLGASMMQRVSAGSKHRFRSSNVKLGMWQRLQLGTLRPCKTSKPTQTTSRGPRTRRSNRL